MMDEQQQKKNSSAGAVYGALSFIIWGFLPLYWKLLKKVPAMEILAHRILWSLVFVLMLILGFKKWPALMRTLKNRRSLLLIFLCSLMIGINWFIYIWAVNSGHMVECSMGYYINPLLAVFLGVFVLKERLSKLQYGALILAGSGVLVITLHYGGIPWISLTLAISFGLYGLFKKMVAVESLISLAVETAVLAPAALALILVKQTNGTGALISHGLTQTLLLLGAGIATATPLILFAKGANRVALSTMGFLQYISPTISLILGVFVFKERFTSFHFLSFGLIWAGIAVYSLSQPGIAKLVLKSRKVGGAEV